jgi:rod shape-determining protein MreD
MNIDFFKHIALMVVLVLAHLLVLNYICLWGVAAPMMYLYVVSTLRRGYPKWGVLLWGFVTGIAIDTIQNTSGLVTASMTLVAAVQPYLLDMCAPREADEHMQVSLEGMGWSKMATYLLMLVLVHCVTLFTLEFFSFYDPKRWALSIVGSTAVTLLMLLAIELAKGSGETHDAYYR